MLETRNTLTALASSTLTVRVSDDLRDTIERDAQRLGVSLADAIRMRLRTGHVPGEQTRGIAR